jgi:hypothetical protein
MAALVIVLVLIALGVLGASGRGVDSSDPEYGVGPILRSSPHH